MFGHHWGSGIDVERVIVEIGQGKHAGHDVTVWVGCRQTVFLDGRQFWTAGRPQFWGKSVACSPNRRIDSVQMDLQGGSAAAAVIAAADAGACAAEWVVVLLFGSSGRSPTFGSSSALLLRRLGLVLVPVFLFLTVVFLVAVRWCSFSLRRLGLGWQRRPTDVGWLECWVGVEGALLLLFVFFASGT